MKIQTLLMMLVVATLCGHLAADEQRQYPVVGTGQVQCFDASGKVTNPSTGQDFFGQDAQSASLDFSFRDNGDGTVTDLNTGLMWQTNPGKKRTLPTGRSVKRNNTVTTEDRHLISHTINKGRGKKRPM